ncbi:hypothetical protein ABKN59_010580 [Abortiporus biennis]
MTSKRSSPIGAVLDAVMFMASSVHAFNGIGSSSGSTRPKLEGSITEKKSPSLKNVDKRCTYGIDDDPFAYISTTTTTNPEIQGHCPAASHPDSASTLTVSASSEYLLPLSLPLPTGSLLSVFEDSPSVNDHDCNLKLADQSSGSSAATRNEDQDQKDDETNTTSSKPPPVIALKINPLKDEHSGSDEEHIQVPSPHTIKTLRRRALKPVPSRVDRSFSYMTRSSGVKTLR